MTRSTMLLSFTTNPIDILTYGAERDGANLLDVITFSSECRELHPIIESHFSGPINNKSVSRPTLRGQLADSTTVACIWFPFLFQHIPFIRGRSGYIIHIFAYVHQYETHRVCLFLSTTIYFSLSCFFAISCLNFHAARFYRAVCIRTVLYSPYLRSQFSLIYAQIFHCTAVSLRLSLSCHPALGFVPRFMLFNGVIEYKRKCMIYRVTGCDSVPVLTNITDWGKQARTQFKKRWGLHISYAKRRTEKGLPVCYF